MATLIHRALPLPPDSALIGDTAPPFRSNRGSGSETANVTTGSYVFLPVSSAKLLTLVPVLCIDNGGTPNSAVNCANMTLAPIVKVLATFPSQYSSFKPKYFPDTVVVHSLCINADPPGTTTSPCCIHGFLVQLPLPNLARLDTVFEEGYSFSRWSVPISVQQAPLHPTLHQVPVALDAQVYVWNGNSRIGEYESFFT